MNPGLLLSVYTCVLVSVTYRTKINRIDVEEVPLSEVSPVLASEGEKGGISKCEVTDGNSETVYVHY